MSRAQFYGAIVLTGYLEYLLKHFRAYLHEYVIDHFEQYNPEQRDPIAVAASHDFYIGTVVPTQSELSELFVALTVENCSAVLDELSGRIVTIKDRQYPLQKLPILRSFIETQMHLEQPVSDEIRAFLKRRLLDRNLYFG